MSELAHYHGQVWNAAARARSLGVNESTVRRYLDLLTQARLVRQLQPWFANLGKRQVKAPKVYVSDSGVLHSLLGVGDAAALARHPKSGASWEGYALDQILRIARPDEAYFWATHAGAELDLLMVKGGRRVGVEFKRSDAPQVTPSMRIALADLELDSLYVVYPGLRRYRLGERIEAVPLAAIAAQRANAVRAKPAEMALSEADVADAVAWARGAGATSAPKAAKPGPRRRRRA